MDYGESVWYARRIKQPNATISEYEKPVEIVLRPNHFTVMKATTGGIFEIMKFGETAENKWTVIANALAFSDMIKQGDEGSVMWVEGESPLSEHNVKLEEEYGCGSSANAVIKNVAKVRKTISITLERNTNQVTQ